MSDNVDRARRTFVGSAVLAIAAAELGNIGPASAQPGKAKPVKPGTNKSFAPLKQVDAGVLNVAYAEAGPATGPVVILLHGWPYDIHSFAISTDGLLSDLHGSSDYRAHLIKVMAQRALAA